MLDINNTINPEEIAKRKIHWVKFNLPDLSFEDDEEREEEDDDELSPWEIRENMEFGFDTSSSSKIMGTPLGLISVKSKSDYDNSYKMWTCHTNFWLTRDDFMKINKVEGVEGLQPISNYRFNVIFGYLFNEETVKKSIQKTIMSTLDDVFKLYAYLAESKNPSIQASTQKKLDAAISVIEKRYCAIFVYPNEQMRILQVDKLDADFCTKVQELHALQTLLEGYLHVFDKNSPKV